MMDMAASGNSLLYLIPLLPSALRLVLVVRFWEHMREIPKEEEQDREGHRTLIVAFAGFSFSGVVALVVLESAVAVSFKMAVYFLLVSFLGYLASLNLQGYKADRWQGELAEALSDTGSLCLVAALISVLTSSKFDWSFVVGAGVLAAAVWLVDELARLRFDWEYLAALGAVNASEEEGGEKAS